MRFRRTFRKRPFVRAKRPVPDVVPVHVCNFPVNVGLSLNEGSLETLCAGMENGHVPGLGVTTTATVLLDGGQFSQFGPQQQGMTKGMKFRSIKAQFDYIVHNTSNDAGADHPLLLTLYHGLVKVKMWSDPSGNRIVGGFPNLMSRYDSDTGEVLWRQVIRFLVPPSLSGTMSAWSSLMAGTVQDNEDGVPRRTHIDPMGHGTIMSCSNRRNLREDEAILWIQQGYFYDVSNSTPEYVIQDQVSIDAMLYGRMTCDNWQS